MSDAILIVVGTPSEQIQMIDALFADHLALSQDVFRNTSHLLIVKLLARHWTYHWYGRLVFDGCLIKLVIRMIISISIWH